MRTVPFEENMLRAEEQPSLLNYRMVSMNAEYELTLALEKLAVAIAKFNLRKELLKTL